MNKMVAEKAKIVTLLVVFAALALLLQSQAFGAVSPSVVKILTVPTPGYPNASAAGSDGAVYVSDAHNKSVHMFASSGVLKSAIALRAMPTAIAVSPSNQLYVGQVNGGSGFIDVFTADGVPVTKINGMIAPVSIAFRSSGEAFVIDGHQLRKFDASMASVQQFGGVGTFIDPKAVAVLEQPGEVYVLDRGKLLTGTAYGDGTALFKDTPVWRVQVFNAENIAAGPVRSFSSYGYGAEGKLGSASSLAVDGAGRVYISDNAQNIIGVFDSTNGAYVSTIFQGDASINPINISYTSAGRLYLTSGVGKFVSVFGVDSFADMRAVPASLNIAYQASAGDMQKSFALANIGSGASGWTAQSNASWLTVAPASGQIEGKSEQALTATIVGAEAAKLTGPVHNARINIDYNGGSVVVPVTMNVVGQPVLSVAPAVVNITKTTGGIAQPVDVTVTIANDVTGAKVWQSTSSETWLTITPKASQTTNVNGIATTTTTAQVGVSTDPASVVNLNSGQYTGLISISADGAGGSPATITVNLTVVSSGRVVVNTDNKDASFTITGPDKTYFGSGLTYSIDPAPAGEYTVTFDRVNGFALPAPQKQTLADGKVIVFNAAYSDLGRKMSIVASHGAGPQEKSDIAVFSSDGTPVLQFTAFPFKYGANTAVGDFDGNGVADILAGSGGGNRVPAAVKGFHRDGAPIAGLAFAPYRGRTGVEVAAGDFDGDRKDEIITGDASGATTVRIFAFDKDNGAVADTGVIFEAFPGVSGGVLVASADLDGDGAAELIAAARSKAGSQDIKVFNINTAAGMGSWTAELATTFTACGNIPSGMVLGSREDNKINIAAADADADGIAEIVAVCNAGAGPEVRIFGADGGLQNSFGSGPARLGFVAAGDLNMDGLAEIVLGASNMSSIGIMSSTGQFITGFNPFPNSLGVKVTVGNLGY